MNSRIVIVTIIALVALVILPVSAEVYSNMQSWNASGIGFAGGGYGGLTSVSSINSVYLYEINSAPPIIGLIMPLTAFPSTYAAYDCMLTADYFGRQYQIKLYDGSYNQISSTMVIPNSYLTSTFHRVEMKVIGGTPNIFVDSNLVTTGAGVSVNPSFMTMGYNDNGPNSQQLVDNILYGGTDHHVIGSLPINYTLIRDFINPANTGVFALSPSGTSYVGPLNSNTFYIDADCDSQDGIDIETLQISNVNTGIVVNSTVVDSSIPYHKIAYNLTDFLANSNVIDGLYSVGYTDSAVRDYFWVVSNGGFITFDKSTYNIGETGLMSWYLSAPYIDLTNYDYTYRLMDVYGNVKASGPTATTPTDTNGTVSITFDSSTYTQGVLYAQMIATGKTGTPYQGTVHVLGTTAITLVDYVSFNGVVCDGQSELPISGATVIINQGALNTTITTPASGTYAASGFSTGAITSISVSKSGYVSYTNSFSPLSVQNNTINLGMRPTSTNTVGIAIGGFVRDQTYGSTVQYATVYVENTTYNEYYTKTANSCGYYVCDDGSSCSLVNHRQYNIFGSKTPGYGNSSVYTFAVNGS